jgi:RHS repeat-associated protein
MQVAVASRQLLAVVLCALLAVPAQSLEKTPAPPIQPRDLTSGERYAEARLCVVEVGVTYDYDAFGNLIHSTGTTPNNYLFASEQFDPDLNLYYNRARYLNTSTGRFWSMDDYPTNPSDPGSLHRYLYVQNNPVNAFDPTGNQSNVGEAVEEAEDIEKVAQDANAVQKVLNGIERATEAEEAVSGASGGPSVSSFVAAAVRYTTAAAAQALQGYVTSEEAKNACSCGVVFHYTDILSAAEIYRFQFMFTSREIKSRGLPAGAYATDIAPWDLNYTQMDLKRILYFSPARQISQSVTAFVALCNDVFWGFHAIPNQPHQFVKEGEYPGFVPVNAVVWGLNAMRKGE